jgi:hypothetical protein
MNPEKKQNSEETTKALKSSVIHYIEQLAAAMGQEIPAARQVFYVNELGALEEPQLEYAFGRALRECKFFPQIAELLEFAADWTRTESERKRLAREAEATREILSRPSKPSDWGIIMPVNDKLQ